MSMTAMSQDPVPGSDQRPVTILIVDDNPIIRIGLRLLLQPEPDLLVVGEAGDGDEALALAERYAPDVVLLDVRMPGRSGLDALPELAARSCVLMLTSSEEDTTIRAALDAGARGYLIYGTMDEATIVHSIRTTARGGSVFSAGAAAALLGAARASGPSSWPERPEAVAANGRGLAAGAGGRVQAPGGELSEREVAVMNLLAAGRSNAEIAAELFLAPKTVKNHINRIFAKLQVTSRSQAMALWLGSAERRP